MQEGWRKGRECFLPSQTKQVATMSSKGDNVLTLIPLGAVRQN